jgi:hypothetical protein
VQRWRLWLPRALAFAALALVAWRAARSPLGDVDVGWITAAGKRILQTHEVPRVNGYSFVAPEHPWIMHEWGFGVLYALGYGAFGVRFFAMIAAAATMATGALVVDRAFRALAPAFAAVLCATLFVVAFERMTSARPIGVVTLLAAIMVVIAPRRTALSDALCVLVELVWTNLHGSFPLGLVILAAMRARPAALVTAGASTILNPYGLRLWGHVLRYAFGTDETIAIVRERVLEFAPVWRAGYHAVVTPFELAALVVLGAFAAHRRSLLAALLVGLALLQARNVTIALVVGTLVVLDAKGARERWIAPVAACAAALVCVFARAAIDDAIGGAAFVGLVHRLPDGARVFVPFRSSGLLLLYGAERGVTTFYDARNDCYPPAIARLALRLKDGILPEGGLVGALRGTEWAIVPSEAYVRATPGDARFAQLALLEPALRGYRVEAREGGWLLLRSPE